MPGKSGAKGLKRLILKRFPYDIVVIESTDEVIIIAVAHHSRKPGYWRQRISP
jgi:toxin ParE1/3/4